MAIIISKAPLNPDQALNILTALSALSREENQDAKLNFEPQTVYLGSNSSIRRTISANWKYYWGDTVSLELVNLPVLIDKVNTCTLGMKFQDIKVLGSFRNAVLDAVKGLEDLKKKQYEGLPDKAKLIDKAVTTLRSTEVFFGQSVENVTMSTEQALDILDEISKLAKDRLKETPLYFSPASADLKFFRTTYPYLSTFVSYVENLPFLIPLIKKVAAVLGKIDFASYDLKNKTSQFITDSLNGLKALKQHNQKEHPQLLDSIKELEKFKQEFDTKSQQHLQQSIQEYRTKNPSKLPALEQELQEKNSRIEQLEKELREVRNKYDQLRKSVVVEAMKDAVIDASVTPEKVMGQIHVLLQVLTTLLHQGPK